MTLSLALLMLACQAPDGVGPEATSVGNPGKMTARTAKGQGTESSYGELAITGLEVTSCAGQADAIDLDLTLDLVNGTELELTAGDHCGLVLFVDPPLVLEGVGTEGGSFLLTLEISEVTLATDLAFEVDDDFWVLELASPGWLDADVLFEGTDRLVEVDQDSPFHDRLASAVANGSGLFRDTDDDGDVGDEERDRGSEARGDERDDRE